MIIVTDVIGSFIEAGLIIMMGLTLIGYRYNKDDWIKILLISLLSSLIFIVADIFFTSVIKLLVTVTLFTIVQYIFLKLTIVNAMLSAIIGFLMLLITELLTVGILNMFFSLNKLIENPFPRLLTAVPHFVLMFSLSVLFYKKKIAIIPKRWSLFKQSKKGFNNLEKTALLILVTALFVFHLILLQIMNTKTINLLFLSGYILIVIFFMYFIRTNFQIQVYKIEHEIDKDYQQEMVNYFRYIKSQRHDFIHHINTIIGLLNQGDYDTCQNYLTDIKIDVEDLNQVLPIKSPAISSMLLTYKQLAKDDGIDLNIMASTPLEHLRCKIYEFNQLTGNLIKNSIEEVVSGSYESKRIDVVIEEDHQYFYIRVTNPFCSLPEGHMSNFFEEGFTTKGVSHEGIGLASVQRIIDAYDGILYTSINNNEITFNVGVPKGGNHNNTA